MSKDATINKDTIKRLVKDVKEMRKHPLIDDGIYYMHDEEDFLKGYAMIVGPKDSLYYGGYYFFTFQFPTDYPFSPPILQFKTNNGITRFHPNLYKTGKVCLSILNTWQGSAWSSCQTIRSILLVILSILDNKPLLHEPGFEESSIDFKPYTESILYRNIEFSIIQALSEDASNYFDENLLSLFKEPMIENFEQNKNNILEFITSRKKPETIMYII